MSSTTLSKITIPKYSLSEELLNAISHGIGAALGIAGLVVCIVISAIAGDAWKVVSSCVYGSSLVILYSMSTIYHALKVNKAKKVFRIIDHCSIYILIAGTYTPYTLVTLRGATGWVIFGIVWGAAIVGIILNAVDMKRYKVISMIAYLAMGWAIVFAFKPLATAMDIRGVYLLLAGGGAYTIGSIAYGIGSKVKYMHSLFHLFVLIGSVLHFISIFMYVL